jgi:3-phosphoshikimate 1-carboxyvinyltransferase
LLNEKPYIKMTLAYLDAHNILYKAAPDFSHFAVPGGAAYKPLSSSVPGDFSSAAFPACAAAVSGGPVTLLGLDPEDTQGDRLFLDMLARMGCDVKWGKTAENPPEQGEMAARPQWSCTVSRSGSMRGGIFDLNATPDLLPAAVVAAAFAEGDTALVNVAHARIKETDRITVMAEELSKLGVSCTERPDGLIINGKGARSGGQTALKAGAVDGRGDHRIVMAFAAGALCAEGPVEIESAESADVTYPGFLKLLEAE